MDSQDTLRIAVSGRGIVTLTLNRPDKANSYDEAMFGGIKAAYERFGDDPTVRVIVLRGAGKHFSAGAVVYGERRGTTGVLCELIDLTAKPTIAVIQGACIGGAVAFVACCDIVVASHDAFFALPEVRLGFSPGPLLPYLVRAVGVRALRRYILSGERFSSETALRIGLVHEVCDAEALEAEAEKIIDACLHAAPGAFKAAKERLLSRALSDRSPEGIAALQALEVSLDQDEIREGRESFQQKRPPRWYLPR